LVPGHRPLAVAGTGLPLAASVEILALAMSGAGVHSGGREVSYGELRSRAARVATGLAELDVGVADRVAVVLRNEPAFLEISLGVGLLGAVPVPVNWHWRGPELSHLLCDSASRAVFVHADLLEGVEAVLPPGVRVIEVPVAEEVAGAYGVAREVSGRHPEYEAWLAGVEPWAEEPSEAPMSVIYTSGTTGLPKGVVRAPSSPEDRAATVRSVLRYFGLEPSMRTLIPAPMYHTAPNVHSLFAAALGIDLTLMPRFDAEDFLRLVQARRINHAQMVPTMFVRLLALPEAVRARYDTSSLQAIVHAAAPCPPHVKQRMIEWLGPIILEYYGGTETGAVSWCDSEGWLAHPGSVGCALEGASLRILGERDEVLGPGEVGRVFARPPEHWPRFTYLGDEEKRRRIEVDGHVTLGDVGYLDDDGYLYLTDRASDMVISGGVNIYPAEVEGVLLALPGVRDAAVFGIPDEVLGEVLAAHLDADPEAGLDEHRVRDHVRERLAAYKVPRLVVFDSALPREDSGKLFKRRLRERYWAATGRSI
jgi:long-chain acyl-CoA synthetase